MELLVVLMLLAFCACLVLTATARTAVKPKAVLCVNNLRQLTAGVAMYAQEHAELFPPNPDGGNTISGHNWCPGIYEYDPATVRKSLLLPYVGRQIELFRCPADPRPLGLANGASAGQSQYAGKLIPPARSISMNGAVGTICGTFKQSDYHQGPPLYAVNGPWLNNEHTHISGQPWRTYGKAIGMVAPSPSGLWLLLDENTIFMNDAAFAFGMNTAEWIDAPGIAHEMAGAFGFADAHAEIHKWTDPRTRITAAQPRRVLVPGSADWLWMSQCTSAKTQ